MSGSIRQHLIGILSMPYVALCNLLSSMPLYPLCYLYIYSTGQSLAISLRLSLTSVVPRHTPCFTLATALTP